MRIFVIAKPGAKKESVKEISPNLFEVSVKEPPREGKANGAVIRAFGKYRRVSIARIRLVSGHTSRKKVLEIL